MSPCFRRLGMSSEAEAGPKSGAIEAKYAGQGDANSPRKLNDRGSVPSFWLSHRRASSFGNVPFRAETGGPPSGSGKPREWERSFTQAVPRVGTPDIHVSGGPQRFRIALCSSGRVRCEPELSGAQSQGIGKSRESPVTDLRFFIALEGRAARGPTIKMVRRTAGSGRNLAFGGERRFDLAVRGSCLAGSARTAVLLLVLASRSVPHHQRLLCASSSGLAADEGGAPCRRLTSGESGPPSQRWLIPGPPMAQTFYK